MVMLGDQKCIGPDLYEWRGHEDLHTGEIVAGWVLVEGDSPQCPVEPPEPEEPEPEPEPITGPTAAILITAPNSAEEGEEVSVSAKVMNVSTGSFYYEIRLLAVRDINAVPSSDEKIGSLKVLIKSAQSQVVSGTFTMPAWDTTFVVMVYRLDDYWDFDNYKAQVITSIPLPSEYPATDIKNIVISVVGR